MSNNKYVSKYILCTLFCLSIKKHLTQLYKWTVPLKTYFPQFPIFPFTFYFTHQHINNTSLEQPISTYTFTYERGGKKTKKSK